MLMKICRNETHFLPARSICTVSTSITIYNLSEPKIKIKSNKKAFFFLLDDDALRSNAIVIATCVVIYVRIKQRLYTI